MQTNKSIFYFWIILFGLVLFSYRNSFDNDFHFDDAHTIQNNIYIQDLHNIPMFFGKDGYKAFSSLPSNQVYRPMVTTQIALSYWLSTKLSSTQNGYDTFYYRIITMFEFLVMLVLFYLFGIKLFRLQKPVNEIFGFVLFGVALLSVHMVYAETLNYIIAMSDLASTMWMLCALVCYQYFPKYRKFGLYLLPFFLAVLTKQTAVVFLPLLLIYQVYFEYSDKNKNIRDFTKQYAYDLGLTFVATIIGAFLVLSFQNETYNPGGSSRWLYLITQPLVVSHYFVSFFVPYNLSADSDWHLLTGFTDWRVWLGFSVVFALLFLAFKTFQIKKMRPISFGILWFFITLAPTSSIIPLAEVLNDHRMFLPFVGLMISFIWTLYLLYFRFERYILKNQISKNLFGASIVIVILAHSYGTYTRTEVWDNGESLWKDVSIKSPKNGRGLMNYGLQLMRKGDMQGAMKLYDQALQYSPYYSYLHTNRAIALASLGRSKEAELSHKKAIECGLEPHSSYFYYGSFLADLGRTSEAIVAFETSLKFLPEYVFSAYRLMDLYQKQDEWEKLNALCTSILVYYPNEATTMYYKNLCKGKKSKLETMENIASQDPTSDNLINLSLEYYNAAKFDKMIEVCTRVIKMDSKNSIAYNNLVCAYNALNRYDEAIAIGNKGLKIDPTNQLLKNNIEQAKKRKDIKNVSFEGKSSDELIELSLNYYNEKMYVECILACKEAIKKQPKNAIAWNNICSAYNALGEWEKAINAGNQALRIDSKFELAKNNLNYAKQQLKR